MGLAKEEIKETYHALYVEPQLTRTANNLVRRRDHNTKLQVRTLIALDDRLDLIGQMMSATGRTGLHPGARAASGSLTLNLAHAEQVTSIRADSCFILV